MDRAGAALERPVVDNCDLCRPVVDLDFHIGPRRNMLPLRPVRPLGFIEPCQPTTAVKPPIGKDWIHEIKHDGYRMLARREGARVRLFSRNGNDWSDRFPSVVEAIEVLKVRSCLLDGELVVCDESGLAVFELLRNGRQLKREAHLIAFDLIELDGRDLRAKPLQLRKAELGRIMRGADAACSSARTSTSPATSCSRTPASSAARASCPSAWARATGRARRSARTGSS
jgi:ATP-dependent DNA ligase